MPTRTAKRAPKSADEPDATRAKLLESAAEVFAQVGYDRAKVREICARAGVNNALVNYHFGDKLELYNQVLQGLVSRARIEAVRAAMHQEAPPEKILREVIKTRLRASTDDPSGWLFRILSHEMAHPTPAMIRIVNGVMRPVYSQLCEVVGVVIALPADAEETRLCAHSIMGQVVLYVLARPVLSRLWPELKMTPDQMDRIADHIADFSLAYLRQTRSKNSGG